MVKSERYPDKMIAYFHRADHAGRLDESDSTVVVVEAGRADQGNVLRLYLQCHEGRITAARFLIYGSVALTACSEYACEWLEGKTMEQAKEINAQQILRSLDMSSIQIHASLLVEKVIKKALEGHYETA